MKDKTTIQVSKNEIFAFILFLLFFPLKTQFYNVTYFLFDILITRGEISEVFTFNYLGHLLGCLEIKELKESLGFRAEIFNIVTSSLLFLLSLVSWFLLKKRLLQEKIFNKKDWLLFAIFCFSLVDSLEFLLNFFNNFLVYLANIQTQFIRIIKNFVILIIAIYFFFKICNLSMKKQILFIVFPSSLISFIIWFFYFGPIILPIVIK